MQACTFPDAAAGLLGCFSGFLPGMAGEVGEPREGSVMMDLQRRLQCAVDRNDELWLMD